MNRREFVTLLGEAGGRVGRNNQEGTMRRKYQRPRNRKAVAPHVERRTTYKNVIPTSHRDLFVGPDGRLIHRTIGQLSHNANHQIAMPDGATLKVYYGAPAMSVRLTSQPGILLGGDGNAGDIADIIALFTVFSETAAPYL